MPCPRACERLTGAQPVVAMPAPHVDRSAALAGGAAPVSRPGHQITPAAELSKSIAKSKASTLRPYSYATHGGSSSPLLRWSGLSDLLSTTTSQPSATILAATSTSATKQAPIGSM